MEMADEIKAMLNGTDSHTPALALSACLRTHNSQLEAASVELINEHILFAQWMRSIQPPKNKIALIAPPLARGLGHAEQSDLTWSQLTTLQAMHIPTLRYVPRGCMGLYLSVVAELLACAASPGEHPGPSELFLVLPKLVFPAIQPGCAPGKPLPHSRQRLHWRSLAWYNVVSGSHCLSRRLCVCVCV